MSNISFIIIGAQKSGTSSLYKYITDHPEISRTKKKELHYFDLNFDKGKNWYLSHFQDNDNLTGEASPYYIFHPHVFRRIKNEFPDVKLIVLLRNPADRAISHYYHNINKKREPLSIQHAFYFEKARLEKEFNEMLEDEHYNSYIYQHYSYKKRGIFFEQLQNYFDLFNRKQLFTIQSEKLFNTPESVLVKIWRFLEVDENFIPDYLGPVNKSNIKKEVSNKFYNELKEFYIPYNKKLFELLECEYDW